MRRSWLLALVAVVGTAPAAAAQSLFAARGLGVPVAPVDGRVRALGGIGVGLLGLNTSLVNPAEVAGVGGRGVSAAFQPSGRSVELDGARDDVGATRFPLLHVIYPVSDRLVATLGYGGYLDQSWGVVMQRNEVVGGDTVLVRDVLESNGGLSQFRVGFAYSLTPTLAVGAAAGLYGGSVERVITRTFPDTVLGPVSGFQRRVRWSERAPLLSAGIRWDPIPILRFGGSLTWAGRLDLERRDDDGDGAGDESTRLPLQAAAGASAYLGPRVIATVGAAWAGWNVAGVAGPGLDGTVESAGDTWDFGGGIEWAGPTAGNREFPIRLGFHYGQLPFTLRGSRPTEWSASLGLGLRVAPSEYGPIASADLAFERGSRGDVETTGLAEQFWRVTLSLSLFGN